MVSLFLECVKNSIVTNSSFWKIARYTPLHRRNASNVLHKLGLFQILESGSVDIYVHKPSYLQQNWRMYLLRINNCAQYYIIHYISIEITFWD